MPAQSQPWLRAELIAAPETLPGAQLMIPADGVEFHDDQLVFHLQGEVVYVARQGQLRSISWSAKQPNPEQARRRAQWPNHGTRWTDEEREDLHRRLKAGQGWQAISTAHGRSRTGCQQEALKQGWLDPDTLRPRPELLLDLAKASTAAATNLTADADADAEPAIQPSTADPAASPANFAADTAAGPTANLGPDLESVIQPSTAALPADPAAGPTVNLADGLAPDPGSAADPGAIAAASTAALATNLADGTEPAIKPSAITTASTANFAANLTAGPTADLATDFDPNRAVEPADQATASTPTSEVAAPTLSVSDPTPDGAGIPAAKAASVNPEPVSQNPAGTGPEPPHQARPAPPPSSEPAPPDPARSPGPTDAVDPPPSSRDVSSPPAPHTSSAPPRIPRQRTDSGTSYSAETTINTDADSDIGTGPNLDPPPDPAPRTKSKSRFLSRTQSSLSRATLNAYMNPARGQSGAT